MAIGAEANSCYDFRRKRFLFPSHCAMPSNNVHIVEHPLVEHHLSIVRNKQVGPEQFRQSIAQLATLVTVRATTDLQLRQDDIETPITVANCQILTQRIGLVPILRAGVGMVDSVRNLIPHAEVWHLGLYRDESTAEPVHYYSKLPEDRPVDIALILDPMLATGGSACMACESMLNWGVQQTKIVSVIAAPEGIELITQKYPSTSIYTCAIDDYLNEDKFIVPGLGDAGDRIFNTL